VPVDGEVSVREEYRFIVEQAQLAEQLGYETVWITDSHLICRELWVTLAACAVGTSRIKLGTGLMQISARTPASAAMTAAIVRSVIVRSGL
jgi:alkanesulfonate monooxygenase SsuD/methylene tetrahydromethanopterin reductase-like flavin-dependent oxidoreductase (luciferase family)